MTKANTNARNRVASAERRAKQKLRRLEKNGIRTGSINPLHPVDKSNTQQLKSYARNLENFISRNNRFVAGYDGTPIPYKTYQKYRSLEKAWNKAHDNYWRKFSDQPFITAYGESDTTMSMLTRIGNIKGLPYKGIDFERNTPANKLRGISDIENRIAILRKELSPAYQRKRTQKYRSDLIEHVSFFNEPQLGKEIRKLTNEQLFALQNFTNFTELYYRYLNTDQQTLMGDYIDSSEYSAQVEHLKLTIEQIKENY